MKHFKEGVQLSELHLEIVEGLIAATVVYTQHGYEFVVTSLGEGTHRSDSLHYKGLAFDLRTRHLKQQDIGVVLRELQATLGSAYDVVLEKDHFHVEYDPKSVS